MLERLLGLVLFLSLIVGLIVSISTPSEVLGIGALENQNIESSNGLSTTTIPVNNATTIIASNEGNIEQFIPSNSLSDSPLQQLQR
jgi:hypothetical protein